MSKKINAMDLANEIVGFLKDDFDDHHLSRNLANTIYITKDSNGVHIHIPAKIYDIDKWVDKGVIIPTNTGSYAESLNQIGSDFYIHGKHKTPHNHIGYIDYSITFGIDFWMQKHHIKGSWEAKYE